MAYTTTNLTRGSILKNSYDLSWPMLVSYFLQVTISLVDIKMVSHLGNSAIAGIGLAQQFIMLSFLLFTAVSVGASIYLAQYTGKDDIQKVKETIVQTLFLSVIIGFLLAMLGTIFIWPLLVIMGVEKNVLDQAYSYASIIFYFSPAMLLNFTMVSIFRSTGDSKTPLFIMIGINILNVMFNYLFIYGFWVFPKMDIAGAATGTVLSRITGVIASLIIMYKRDLLFKVKNPFDMFRNSMYAPRFAPMRKIFTLGFPSALQDVSWSISMLAIYKIMAFLPQSTLSISAFSIAFNVEAVCFMPGIAFMQAATIMVGQHIGAGKIIEAEKAGWINTGFGSLFMAILGIPVALFSGPIIRIFTSDAQVVEIGRIYLILMGLTQFFIGSKFILMGALNGAGDTKTPFYAELLEHWAYRIPLIITIVFLLGERSVWPIWTVMASSNIINAGVVFYIFRKGFWKKINLI